MEKIEIQAENRTIVGRQVKTLRNKGILPAVVYGKGFSPVNVQIPLKEFERVYRLAGESTLVYLQVGGETYPTIISDVSKNAVNESLQHADFYKVSLTEKIHAKVPLMIVGVSEAVSGLGGILVRNMNELEVEGLPQDLPHEIQVDISKLVNFGDQVLIKDLAISDKLEIKTSSNEIVVLIQEPISEDELKAQLETPTTAAEDVEVIKRPSAEVEVGVEPTSEAVPSSPKP